MKIEIEIPLKDILRALRGDFKASAIAEIRWSVSDEDKTFALENEIIEKTESNG